MERQLGITPALSALLSSAYDHLPHKPARTLLAPGGEVAWDDCCEGQLWVRVTSVSQAYITPRGGGAAASQCQPVRWDLSLAVGILRCAAVLDDDGNAPTPRAITADAAEMVEDMGSLADAVICHDSTDLERVTLGSWTPLGPQGGCHGGEWAVTATVLVCACETPEHR